MAAAAMMGAMHGRLAGPTDVYLDVGKDEEATMRLVLVATGLCVLASVPNALPKGHLIRATSSPVLARPGHLREEAVQPEQISDVLALANSPSHVGAPAGTAVPTSLRARLTIRGASTTAQFGWSVALDAAGITALIGQPGANAAYVFVRRGSSWTQQARLTDPAGRSFGSAVALNAAGTIALIGEDNARIGGANVSPEKVTGPGAAYVFARSGRRWIRQARLTAGPSAQDRGQFGEALALNETGTLALIGAPGETIGERTFAGAAYVFARSRPGWTRQARLTAGRFVQTVANFGVSVALNSSGTVAVVGADIESVGPTASAGAAHVFVQVGGRWRAEARLTAGSFAQTSAAFGVALSLDRTGTVALVGASTQTNGANRVAGATYVFARQGRGWVQKAQLRAPSPREKPAIFGFSVALDRAGTTALVGAPAALFAAGAAGAVYAFTRSGGRWMQRVQLSGPSRGQSLTRFGWSLALASDGTTAVVGAPPEAIGKSNRTGCLRVRRSEPFLTESLERIRDWDEAQQGEYFRRSFDPDHLQIVEVDGEDVGVLRLEPRPDELFLRDIQIAASHQGKGLGSALIRDIQAEACKRRLPVTLRVLRTSRSLTLYKRLGFVITGEGATEYAMARVQR